MKIFIAIVSFIGLAIATLPDLPHIHEGFNRLVGNG